MLRGLFQLLAVLCPLVLFALALFYNSLFCFLNH